MRSKLPMIAIGTALVLVGFAAGVFVNLSFAKDESSELQTAYEQIESLNGAITRSEDRLWTLYREREAMQAQLDAAYGETGYASSTDSTSSAAYGDGVWIVDESIPAGEYDGDVTGEFGYWARLERTDGTIHAIIHNGIERGPFVLEIIPSDKAIELQGVVLTPR